MLITGKLHSARRYRSFRDTSFASTFVRERKVRGVGGGKRVGREGGNYGKKREIRAGTKVGYSMARVIARRHIRNARCKCERKRKEETGESEEQQQLEDPKPHELRWMDNGTAVHRNTTEPPIPL